MNIFKRTISSIKAWYHYNNPYYPWWNARKVFKRPKWHLYHIGKITWFYGLPVRDDYYNCILDIKSSSLGWKDKYNSPRHEWDPYIAITLFRKWQVVWIFTYYNKDVDHSNNDATWEGMLDYLFYDRTIEEVIKNNTWKIHSTNELITIENNIINGRSIRKTAESCGGTENN